MDLTERTILYAKAEKDPRIQAIHLELCKRDPIYWFNHFAWTFDPRKESPDWIPFVLYPYQEWTIKEWLGCIEEQVDVGVEKSRDMGVSWMFMLLFQYCWLFRSGHDFLVGSRKEAEVDTAIVDPSTLFGKFRYNLYRLPRWMRPKGVKRLDKKLSIQNPVNGNLLTGESANPAFGRGRRQRAILMDELAFWDCADAAYGGCSATTKCRIITSTPYGESNRYAQLMNDPRNEYRPFPDSERYLIDKGMLAA